MRKFTSIIRIYKYELIAFIVNIFVAYFAFKFRDNITIFVLSIVVFTASLIFVIYQKTKDKDFYSIPLDKPGEDAYWVGRGSFKFVRNESCYEITNSDVGFIYPKTSLWDDYYLECDFKIINTSLGVIFRAQNLSNCVMIQLFDNKIKSHLRVNGQWIVYGEDKTNGNLNVDSWYKLKAYCEKRKIRISISSGKKELLNRHIIIPDNITVVVKQLSPNSNQVKEEFGQNVNVDFDFGSFGFRNYGKESALVKKAFVEKL